MLRQPADFINIKKIIIARNLPFCENITDLSKNLSDLVAITAIIMSVELWANKFRLLKKRMVIFKFQIYKKSC